MSVWYALTAQNGFITGHGKSTTGVAEVANMAALMALAERYYAPVLGVDSTHFTYAFAAGMAASGAVEMGAIKPIRTLFEALALLNVGEEGAIHSYNSILVSSWAVHSDEKAIVADIIEGFNQGSLLRYPEDSARLQAPEIQSLLPALLLHHLSLEEAGSKAFQRYLRCGTSPALTFAALPTFAFSDSKSTYTAEYKQEQHLLHKEAESGETKGKSPEVWAEIIDIIYKAMLVAEEITVDTEAEHKRLFLAQMEVRFGFTPALGEEPYLEYERKRFELQLLQTLERFLKQMEKRYSPLPLSLATGSKCASSYPHPTLLPKGEGTILPPLLLGEGWGEGYSLCEAPTHLCGFPGKASFDSNKAPVPQVKDRVALETTRMQGRLKQALDKDRQLATGFKKYTWRTQEDEKVRAQHAGYDDQIFAWDNPPPGGHPGEAYGCRCWAEPVIDGIEETYPDAIEPVYPELILIPVSKAGKAIRLILKTTKEAWEEANSFKKPEGVPEEWVKNPSRKQSGTRYTDPDNIHNEVRIQKGRPDSQFPGQQQDYVKWRKNGQWLDKNGNPVSGTSQEAHIPLKEFEFNKELFK